MARLTPREIEVLRAYCLYETHARTAQELRIGVQTVKNHLVNVYRKLGVHKAHTAVYRVGLSPKTNLVLTPYFDIIPAPPLAEDEENYAHSSANGRWKSDD